MDLWSDSRDTILPPRHALFDDAEGGAGFNPKDLRGARAAAETCELWQGLSCGRLRVAGHSIDDAYAWLLVRTVANVPGAAAVAGHPHHSPATLERALSGCAQKVLAFESGVVPSVVSQRLAYTLRSFGLHCAPRFAPAGLVLLAGTRRDVATRAALGFEQRDLGNGSLVVRMLRPDPLLRSRVSQTEYDVLRRVIDGCSSSRVSEMRQRSARTVANQLRSISLKLGVSGRLQYINLALGLAVTPARSA